MPEQKYERKFRPLPYNKVSEALKNYPERTAQGDREAIMRYRKPMPMADYILAQDLKGLQSILDEWKPSNDELKSVIIKVIRQETNFKNAYKLALKMLEKLELDSDYVELILCIPRKSVPDSIINTIQNAMNARLFHLTPVFARSWFKFTYGEEVKQAAD
jgi:hypothetical protein